MYATTRAVDRGLHVFEKDYFDARHGWIAPVYPDDVNK
jgi:hypothetical protein